MFGYFSHRLIRKYVIVFGHLFNDITIERYNKDGVREQTLAIPIAYGPKQKFLQRLITDPDINRDNPISLPRMGFELTSLNYDSERQLSASKKNSHVFSDKTLLKTQFTGVPYNIDFTLSIIVENAEDGTQILEQILPYFKPEWTTSMILVPEMDIVKDTPTILNSVSLQDTYDGDFLTRRYLTWDLTFTMKGELFGPTSNEGVITRSNINFYANTMPGTLNSSSIVVVPGLTPELKPTSNSAASLNRHLIDADDDFGFAANTFFYG